MLSLIKGAFIDIWNAITSIDLKNKQYSIEIYKNNNSYGNNNNSGQYENKYDNSGQYGNKMIIIMIITIFNHMKIKITTMLNHYQI